MSILYDPKTSRKTVRAKYPRSGWKPREEQRLLQVIQSQEAELRRAVEIAERKVERAQLEHRDAVREWKKAQKVFTEQKARLERAMTRVEARVVNELEDAHRVLQQHNEKMERLEQKENEARRARLARIYEKQRKGPDNPVAHLVWFFGVTSTDSAANISAICGEDIGPGRLNGWVQSRRVPPRFVEPLVEASEGYFSRKQLNPQVFPKG